MNKRANGLKPIEKQEITQEEIDSLVENPDDITNTSGLEAYEKAQLNQIKQELIENDRTDLQKTILDLRQENESLKEQIEEMKKNRIATNESDDSCDVNKKLEDIEYENDELILKNSELEFNLEQLKEEINIKNKENERLKKTIEDQKATGSFKKEAYTTGYNNNMFRPLQNGYQEW